MDCQKYKKNDLFSRQRQTLIHLKYANFNTVVEQTKTKKQI